MPDHPTGQAPAYPQARPQGGDDSRFTLTLALNVAAVLARPGYPPINTSADLIRLQQALFGAIYQPKEKP